MSKKNLIIEEKYTLAIKNHKQNNFKAAEKYYLEILEIDSKHFESNYLFGTLLLQTKNFNKAKKFLIKAIEIRPLHEESCNNLGIVFKELNELEEAKKCYERAIKINPNNADAYNNLGNILKILKEYENAEKSYENAIKINPNHVSAYNNLAIIYQNNNNKAKAIKFYKKVIEIEINNSIAYYNLGNLFRDIGDIEESISYYEKAIKINPNFYQSYNNILMCICYTDNDKNYLELANKYYDSIKINQVKKPSFKKKSDKMLKIGFVSGDFRNHPVSYFLLDTIKNLKKNNLKLYAYSNNKIEDTTSKLLKPLFDNWSIIFNKTDQETINQIRRDEIDILFDLSGHGKDNRLPIFKNKCAPIQLNWIGCASSTGIKEIDYIIGDPYASPIEDQHKFTEKIYNLNNIWSCFSTSNLYLDTKISKNKNNYITYGCFNNIVKLNDNVISVWSKILNKVKNSKLFLKYPAYDNPEIKNNILKKLKKFQITDDQIIILGKTQKNELLEYYNKIDIVLDTFPHNGITTNFEAAYMGTPILTKEQNSFMLRCGESINKNLKMDDWIAKDEEDYISKGINFAQNKNFLENLKIELKDRAFKSYLFDSESFSNDFYQMLVNLNKKT